ncbi:transposase [Spiroplasma endosymbiont of Virgichneumon dumeticola]|uniref:transposase n=1 Tax=Spiroplasma endosymbiont of Virgichneumon dumeticola TaxID=3139323 RepID=UPI0035C8CD80
MKLNEFNNTFQTEKQCLAYIASLKQSKCIRCSSFNLNTSNLRKMRCLKCHQTFSILTGTIFSKSQTPLISCFYLIFRWINTKHGIPSTDVAINHISSKCDVHTDSWKGYRDLKSVFTKHETVNHQDGYVSKTGVNTNQIESVWKHIRRTFKTHIKVAKHHIHLYAKEAAYKFNNIPSFETVMLCLI